MIGAIAGDIIGSRFEGQTAPPSDFELFSSDCRFTDDSVCCVAVADALMRGLEFGQVLRAWVRRYPDAGYGAMFIRWALADDAPAYGSWGNGAPMRVAAVGWLAADADEADRLAAAQARVSHNHPDAIAASKAVARTILDLRNGCPAAKVERRVVEAFGYDLRPEVALAPRPFDVSAAGTVPAAMAAALGAKDWVGAVRRAVMLGGDTDTLACIAGAIAEAIHGVPQEIGKRASAYLTSEMRDVIACFEKRRTHARQSGSRRLSAQW